MDKVVYIIIRLFLFVVACFLFFCVSVISSVHDGIIFDRLMGTVVLNTSIVVTSTGQPTVPYTSEPYGFATPVGLGRSVRWYAHCAQPTAGGGSGGGSASVVGGVAVAFANPQLFAINVSLSLSDTGSDSGTFGGVQLSARHEYFLTPPVRDPQGLQSRHVSLNGGVPLAATGTGELSPMPPRVVSEVAAAGEGEGAGAVSVRLPALSFGFIVFPDAQAAACM